MKTGLNALTATTFVAKTMGIVLSPVATRGTYAMGLRPTPVRTEHFRAPFGRMIGTIAPPDDGHRMPSVQIVAREYASLLTFFAQRLSGELGMPIRIRFRNM